jgi:hypothetical protein
MRLWDEIWMRPWRERALDPGYENWIFIAWVFDVPDVFGRLSKELIMNGIVHGGWFSVVRSNAEPVRLDGRIHEKIISPRSLGVEDINPILISQQER